MFKLRHSLRTKNKIESLKSVCENKDFCYVILPSEDTKIWEFNHYQRSSKASFIIYANLEWMIKRIDGCKTNPETTSKESKHILSDFSMSTI